MLAVAFDAAHWEISDDESVMLKDRIEGVARHYDVIKANEKILDWCMLAGALGLVYGPRLKTSLTPKKPKPQAQPQPAPTIYPGMGPVIDATAIIQ